jgi:hypothetical protein
MVMTMLLTFTTFTIVARNKRPENKFKNLKIYPKDVSEEQLDHDMHLFNRSLNVRCNYCHVHENDVWDFASDTKHKKEEAREMMTLTKEINEKYFGVNYKTAKPADIAMNCFTCHRGEEQPIIPWDTAHVKPPLVEGDE